MRRREFIAGLGSTAAWPLAARAQQPMPVVGVLGTNDAEARMVSGLRNGLIERGFNEGQNVLFEYVWASGALDRLPVLAAALTRRHPTLIVAMGGPQSALAAKAATAMIPIVFAAGGDAVDLGIVPSLNRPGGNATGVNYMNTRLEPKRLQLLHDLAPNSGLIGVLVSPRLADSKRQLDDLNTTARAIGLQIAIQPATSDREIELAFRAFAQLGIGALLVASSVSFLGWRDKLTALVAHQKLPAIYAYREFAEAGGLMSYGPDLYEVGHQLGIYAGRILKGEKPADLPVVQPTKVGHQPQDRPSARHDRAADAARHCRRGDRIRNPARQKI
jgi:putative ABC transport system substrate-binding protein